MKIKLMTLLVLLFPGILFAASIENDIKGSVNSIYQLGNSFEKLVSRHEKEEDVKNGLLKIVKKNTTGELLNRWVEFINNTPVSSTFYRTVFESMTARKLKFESVSKSGSKATVKANLQVIELYAPSIDMITLEELYAKYKITNMKALEVINMLPNNSLAELVEYRITSNRQDTHHLKFVDGIWKIAKIDQAILDSSIEVILPKKPKNQ